MGERLAAIVVTWDRDFEKIVKRVPTGNRTLFRRLGRISFRCNEVRGVQLLERWIESIEFNYAQAIARADARMVVQIQESGIKIS
jgi:hypothetical protein